MRGPRSSLFSMEMLHSPPPPHLEQTNLFSVLLNTWSMRSKSRFTRGSQCSCPVPLEATVNSLKAAVLWLEFINYYTPVRTKPTEAKQERKMACVSCVCTLRSFPAFTSLPGAAWLLSLSLSGCFPKQNWPRLYGWFYLAVAMSGHYIHAAVTSVALHVGPLVLAELWFGIVCCLALRFSIYKLLCSIG